MSGENTLGDKNRAEVERLSKLNVMLEIRRQALDIQVRLMDSDIHVVRVAEKDLDQLLEWFYDENQDMVPPEQYNAARNDLGYFLILIEMAISYYGPVGCDTDTVH